MALVNNRWMAKLSDGKVVQEEWIADALSPWQRLMGQCKTERSYITSICIVDSLTGKPIVALPSDQVGYWQGIASHSVQGASSLTYKGIGWVQKDIGLIICWVNGEKIWQEVRSIEGEKQVIWSYGR